MRGGEARDWQGPASVPCSTPDPPAGPSSAQVSYIRLPAVLCSPWLVFPASESHQRPGARNTFRMRFYLSDSVSFCPNISLHQAGFQGHCLGLDLTVSHFLCAPKAGAAGGQWDRPGTSLLCPALAVASWLWVTTRAPQGHWGHRGIWSRVRGSKSACLWSLSESGCHLRAPSSSLASLFSLLQPQHRPQPACPGLVGRPWTPQPRAPPAPMPSPSG